MTSPYTQLTFCVSWKNTPAHDQGIGQNEDFISDASLFFWFLVSATCKLHHISLRIHVKTNEIRQLQWLHINLVWDALRKPKERKTFIVRFWIRHSPFHSAFYLIFCTCTFTNLAITETLITNDTLNLFNGSTIKFYTRHSLSAYQCLLPPPLSHLCVQILLIFCQ